MPTSHFQQLSTIVELIVLAAPASLLDIGAGFGKYGVLAREYLDLRDEPEAYGSWKRRIDAIEIYEPYLTPLHHFIYDHIYIGDANRVLAEMERSYELILLIDVLEHFDMDAGRKLLARSCEIGRNVIVSTPKRFWPQREAFGNPFESHHSHWPRESFSWLKAKCFIRDEISVLCFIGEEAEAVCRHMNHWRRRLKYWFPILKYPYRLLWPSRSLGP